MKAAVIYENGPPEVLRYEDVPDPDCPDGCVLIDVEAISIEGGDLLARAGSPPAKTPHIVGYLCAGTVAEVGAGVESPAVGEKVVGLNADGSHAERRVVPAVDDLARARGPRSRRRRLRPGRDRHGRGVPLHRRRPRGRADGPDPRRRRRGRHGGDPAGQAGGGDGALDRLQRRETRAAEAARPRPPDQLRQGELRRARPRADRRARRRRHRSTRSAARPWSATSRRSPTGGRWSASASPPGRARRSRRNRSGARTTPCAASTSAGRCSPSTRGCIR